MHAIRAGTRMHAGLISRGIKKDPLPITDDILKFKRGILTGATEHFYESLPVKI